MSYLKDMDDPPVPKLVSTVPIKPRRRFPLATKVLHDGDIARIMGRIEEVGMTVEIAVPRKVWAEERMKCYGDMPVLVLAQRFLNNAFDTALGR